MATLKNGIKISFGASCNLWQRMIIISHGRAKMASFLAFSFGTKSQELSQACRLKTWEPIENDVTRKEASWRRLPALINEEQIDLNSCWFI